MGGDKHVELLGPTAAALFSQSHLPLRGHGACSELSAPLHEEGEEEEEEESAAQVTTTG